MPVPRESPLRIYVDASVFGGCFDPQFSGASRRFFRLVRRGRVVVLLSELVTREMKPAPPRVRRILASIRGMFVRDVGITKCVGALSDAYLGAGIVEPSSRDDAIHVAAATVAQADAIVSWNFKGIVGPARIRGYNRVNLREGYGVLTILTPDKVLRDEHE